MCRIKWDEKYFEESGLYIWIYVKGFEETTNEKFYKSSLKDIYSKRTNKIFNDYNNKENNKNRH